MSRASVSALIGGLRTPASFTWSQAAIALAIAAFLVVFLIIPVVTVVYVAFADGAGGLTLSHFATFFHISLMHESFWNSLYVGVWSVGIATVIAVPLAYFTVRFEFRGAALIQTLGVLPLIMPPFLVGLGEYGARRPGQLSGGQQQRVALARTIAVEPKVLLLDEPLSNLDAKLRIHMRVELLALQRKLGITTIFVTHDQEEALSICDRVAVLDGGVIQQVGTPVELYDTPANRFIATFVGTINLLPGMVEQADGMTVFRSDVLGSLRLAEATARPGPAEIAIRPHAIRLAARDGAGDAGLAWTEGRVTQREFLGEFVRYTVQIARTELTADQPHHAGDPGFTPGAAVRVGINPAQVRLLRA